MQLHKSNVNKVPFFSSKKKIMFHRFCSAIGCLVEKKKNLLHSMEKNAENSSMVSIKIGKVCPGWARKFQVCGTHNPYSLPLVEEDGVGVLVGHLCNVL